MAGAFVASLLSLLHGAVLGPSLLPADFGVAYAAFNLFYFFALTGPLAAVGGLLAAVALALVATLRRRVRVMHLEYWEKEATGQRVWVFVPVHEEGPTGEEIEQIVW